MTQEVKDGIHAVITIIALPFFWVGMIWILYQLNEIYQRKEINRSCVMGVKKVCITCAFHDGINYCCKFGTEWKHISYASSFCDKCKNYKLDDDYKKGGKFYKGDKQ